jgi:hypothetical protein
VKLAPSAATPRLLRHLSRQQAHLRFLNHPARQSTAVSTSLLRLLISFRCTFGCSEPQHDFASSRSDPNHPCPYCLSASLQGSFSSLPQRLPSFVGHLGFHFIANPVCFVVSIEVDTDHLFHLSPQCQTTGPPAHWFALAMLTGFFAAMFWA